MSKWGGIHLRRTSEADRTSDFLSSKVASGPLRAPGQPKLNSTESAKPEFF
jgi:hypothetical protein